MPLTVTRLDICSRSESDGLPAYGFVTFSDERRLRFLREYRSNGLDFFFQAQPDFHVLDEDDVLADALIRHLGHKPPKRAYASYEGNCVLGVGSTREVALRVGARRAGPDVALKTARIGKMKAEIMAGDPRGFGRPLGISVDKTGWLRVIGAWPVRRAA
jgi:hypothetical protein